MMPRSPTTPRRSRSAGAVVRVPVLLMALGLAASAAGLATRHIAVVGGGASGVFSAIAAATAAAEARRRHGSDSVTVTVLEATPRTLQKVLVSGGGRCNVMHDADKGLAAILGGYPRGSRELRGLYTAQFGPPEAAAWFRRRGVGLKTEADGRMFPTTDRSDTIVDCLMSAAEEAAVRVCLRTKVLDIDRDTEGVFRVAMQQRGATSLEASAEESATLPFDAVILATGSAPVGYQLAARLGHAIVPTVASLFTLSCKHAVQPGGLLHGLAGVSVPHATVQYRPDCRGAEAGRPAGRSRKPTVVQQEGPLLVTHQGLSGPAALRLSAFAARELAEQRYRAQLRVHWAPGLGGTVDQVFEQLWTLTTLHTKKLVATNCPIVDSVLPRRLWAALVAQAGIPDATRWGDASKKQVRSLAHQIAESELEMTSKGAFKEEFVTAGGVDLKEIDLKTMQSKTCPGLFFCGELINVDGVTGGYNFMNCWGTGYVAGTSAAAYVMREKESSKKC